MQKVFEYIDEYYDDYTESGFGNLEHKYINENAHVNYMSVNGVEYVIGEYDNRDDALLNLEKFSNINKNHKELDWISSREGVNTKSYLNYMATKKGKSNVRRQ